MERAADRGGRRSKESRSLGAYPDRDDNSGLLRLIQTRTVKIMRIECKHFPGAQRCVVRLRQWLPLREVGTSLLTPAQPFSTGIRKQDHSIVLLYFFNRPPKVKGRKGIAEPVVAVRSVPIFVGLGKCRPSVTRKPG